MRESFLSFSPPCLGEEEIAEVADTLKSQWITTGPKTKKFEQEFSKFVDAKSALALNSCTAGLHMALKVLDVGPGDEVITTPLTFCATANVIEHVGAKVVLADIDPETLLIDPKEVAKKITDKTKAIMPVHYAGAAADMETLESLIKGKGIHIVEDAAHAVPTRYKGRMIGSSKNLTSFSFYANKNLSTAEGGMLTGPEDLIGKARSMSLHGMSRDAWKRFDKAGSWRYDVIAPGFKYNMTDIQASLGLVQLKKLPGFQHRRGELALRYREELASVSEIGLPQIPDYTETAWHLFVVRIKSPDNSRDDVIEQLKSKNIGTSVHYLPIHYHSYYRDKYGWKNEDFSHASRAAEEILSLPLNPSMTDQDQTDVIQALKDVLAHA